ncbi:hypothetical protein B5P24_09985 [Clavibacter tessellarius]|uniref:Uncharacterized protein n=1 Tax=Clavibacter tessellarius TaxID=31965 RepID=A0A225CNI0_9MICO|nr:hypothetical protein B5P24_09985 [Clavibacter michiganensis subsp. tessellarius]
MVRRADLDRELVGVGLAVRESREVVRRDEEGAVDESRLARRDRAGVRGGGRGRRGGGGGCRAGRGGDGDAETDDRREDGRRQEAARGASRGGSGARGHVDSLWSAATVAGERSNRSDAPRRAGPPVDGRRRAGAHRCGDGRLTRAQPVSWHAERAGGDPPARSLRHPVSSVSAGSRGPSHPRRGPGGRRGPAPAGCASVTGRSATGASSSTRW